MTQFDTIKARALTKEEFNSVTPEDLIYVSAGGWSIPILEPGYFTGNEYYRRTGSLEVRTIYSSQVWQPLGSVYVADDNGEEFPAIRTSGVRVSSTLYFPDMTEDEARERMYKALRAEFGEGVIEVWNIRSSPIRDVTHDVYAVERDLNRTKTGEVSCVEKSRRTLARGVRDGHERFFRGETPGEIVISEVVPPDLPRANTI